MNDTRKKWDAIYSDGKEVPGVPCRVLVENRHLLPTSGSALEIACGLAGNAILLAEHGLTTRAWDISPVATGMVERYARQHGLPLECEARDIGLRPPEPDAYDVIVVTRFLDRSIIPAISAALRDGGLLFYQTFTRSRVTGAGPGNPEFRLGDNELLTLFGGMKVLVYREEGMVGDTARGLRDEAMVVVQKTAAD